MEDIIAVSKLTVKVSTTYKDAPNGYRHISEKVTSLQMRIDKVVQYFENTTLSDNDRQIGQDVLKSCQSILEDLDSVLSSANIYQVLNEVTLPVATANV